MVDLSSLDIRHLARELAILEDAYIDKVYETASREFLFKMKHREHGKFNLLIKPGSWIALAPEPPETPDQPSSFAMLLRKHLVSTRVRRIHQHEFDRVLVMELERGGEPLRLVIEFFGQGNLILVAGDGTIMVPMKTEVFAHRTIKKGEAFKFPPARPDPAGLDAQALASAAAKSEKDLVRFLAVDASLGGDLAEAGCALAGLEKNIKAKTLDALKFQAIIDQLKTLLERAPEPVHLRMKGKLRLASMLLPQHANEPEIQRFATLSDAILAAESTTQDEAPPERDEEAERLVRQREHQLASIQEQEAEAQRLEEATQGLYTRYAEVNALIQSLQEAINTKGWDQLAREGPTDAWPAVRRVDPKAHRVEITLDGHDFLLDPFTTLEANASTVFDKVKAVRAKAQAARQAVEETERLIAQHEKKTAKLRAQKETAQALSRRVFWFQAYRWFYTSDNVLVIGGRDAASNEKIVKKHMKDGDLYVHADVHGAPSCIIKLEGQTASEATLEEAARFAATFSKAFNQFASSDAYWVRPEQVSKTPQSGEYVPKGAFIVRGTRTYRKDLPLEAGIGTIQLDDNGKPLPPGRTGHRHAMGGPWVSVKAHCRDAIRIARGDEKATTVAKRAAARLDIPVDAAAAVLPTGTLKILEADA